MPLGISIHVDAFAVVTAVADELQDLLDLSPGLVCLSTGPLCLSAYARLARSPGPPLDDDFVVDAVRFGASAGGERKVLGERFFGPLGIDPLRLRAFDPWTESPEAECRRMDNWLDARGPIRVYLAEVDAKGDVGLIRGGTAMTARCHVACATEPAPPDSLFGRPTSVPLGMSLGPRDLVDASHVLACASGPEAGASLRRALGGLVSDDCACSAFRFSRSCHLFVDAPAARALGDDLLRRFSRSGEDDRDAEAAPPFMG